MFFLHQIRLKMGKKGHIIDQEGLKMYEKRQKMEFLDLKYLLFSGIFLSRIGGYPPPLLTENHPAQKPLAEGGGVLPCPLSFFEHTDCPLRGGGDPPFSPKGFWAG